MGGSVRDIESQGELDKVISHGAPAILYFWATEFPHAHFLRDGYAVDTLEGVNQCRILAHRIAKIA